MQREEIRAMIRDRVKAGALPRDLPMLQRIDGPVSSKDIPIIIGSGAGRRCSACDLNGAEIEYRYPNREVAFHLACDEVWQEECGIR